MSFERFLQPRSIAVFGGFAAEELIRQCDLVDYDGELWPVHPKKDEIQGRRVYRSVEDLPDSPDAAYIAVNRYFTIEIVGQLSARGAGGAVCYATGFTESGEEGKDLERQLLAASGEMPLIGPNSYGMLNYVDGAMLWPDQQGGRRVKSGIALITQSSNVAFNLTMQRRGLPIAYVVSLGNKLRFDLDDAIRTFARQETVTAIGLYLEAVSDPHGFEAAVRVARELGKPIVAIKTGRSETSRKIVLSHTASLAGSDELMDALFRRTGVARVNSLEDLMEALKVLHVLGPLDGGRIGGMSTSGGDLSMLGDAMIGSSLSLPPLTQEGVRRVGETVHERIVVANPLDYQMFDWNNADRLCDMFSAFITDDFDVSLCLLDYPRDDKCDPATWKGAEQGIIRAAKATGARIGMLSTFTDTMPEKLAEQLIDDGIVPLAGIETGLAGIQAAVDIGTAWRGERRAPLLEPPDPREAGRVEVLDEAEGKRILASFGVPVPEARVVEGAEGAADAAESIGYPVVVKALGVAHKTEVGGVALNLETREAVVGAVEGMVALADRFLVEKMVEGGVSEIIVGVNRDDQFGPSLVVGGGGILVELMKDSQLLLLPITRADVLAALNQLVCSPLFHGFRGRPKADLRAAADAVLAVAAFVESDPGAIEELDVNPLILLADGRGVCAADALLSVRVAD
jgi:acyl-CoA synthetase (NDP forming)